MAQVKIHEMTVEVQQEHLDENQHVNNVQYLQWVQDVAKAHWEQEAQPAWLTAYVWVALSHHIEYKKPAFLNERLHLRTYIDSFEGVKSHRIVEIYRVDSAELVSKCRTVWVMLDRNSNRPVRCPEDMVAAFYETIE